MTWEHPTAQPARPYLGAYYHTRDNLQERYGITFDLEAYEALCAQLREQRFDGLFTHPNVLNVGTHGRIIIRWRIYGIQTKLVWCPESGLVITALPAHRSARDPDHDPRFVRQQQRHQRAYKRRPKHKGRQ